ncbi:YlqD family protein [Sediminibacillus albus]|uniref:YlqD protein n=1 Tax=Sediminibacillus albus TaxID=407036 RepID=A0A1G8W584_9BACI|nr:YlqD family protein [Sediminibacillus albus]SDJ72885.1 YlqD protein [Sediminibacillus albus]
MAKFSNRKAGTIVKIIRKIPVKQVITEKSKQELSEQFNHNRQQLEQECQQLQFEQRKLQNKKGVSRQEVANRFQKEITKRRDKIKWIEFQVEQLSILPVGSEITEGEVESLVEVEEGYNWDSLVDDKAIIVKDGTVIQIK